LRCPVFETQPTSKAQSLRFADAFLEINGNSDNGIRILGCNFFYVHPSLGRRDQYRPLGDTIIEDGNIVLMGRITTLCEHDLQKYRILKKEIYSTYLIWNARHCRCVPQLLFAL
jgi:hypothetical protein